MKITRTLALSTITLATILGSATGAMAQSSETETPEETETITPIETVVIGERFVESYIQGGPNAGQTEIVWVADRDYGEVDIRTSSSDAYTDRTYTELDSGKQDSESISFDLNGSVIGVTGDLEDEVESAQRHDDIGRVTVLKGDTITIRHNTNDGYDSVTIDGFEFYGVPQLIPAPVVEAPAPVTPVAPVAPVVEAPAPVTPECPYGDGGSVGSDECVEVAAPAPVAPETPVSPVKAPSAPAELAYTGAVTNILIALGLSLLAAGAVCVRASRLTLIG